MMSKQKFLFGSPSSSLQADGANSYGLCKDLDKFTRYFIVKAVQVIVQSRLGGGQKLKTDCRPGGNDWFNINISDIVEISDKTKSVLDSECLSVRLNWRVCCEISLKTSDRNKIPIEHWIISNKSYSNPSSRISASSSIYTIYNRMSLLLKTLLTTTHIVPAYRLASQTSQTDACVICYRVYNVPRSSSSFKGSVEDINFNNSESSNRRSLSSASSHGSIDIREFVGPDELEHFCPIMKLGSVRTEVSEIDISVCYRTDTRDSSFLPINHKSKGIYNRILGGDCLTTTSHKSKEMYDQYLEEDRLTVAFASENGSEKQNTNHTSGCINNSGELSNGCDLIEAAFDNLLVNNHLSKDKSTDAHSEPIQVPCSKRKNHASLTPGSTPKSLTDSYVFVDLNPPFASDEQNDINSFFHGPSPSFSNGLSSVKDVEELTSQLASFEANASQIDDFVDNMCASEDEEEKPSKTDTGKTNFTFVPLWDMSTRENKNCS